MHGIEHKNIDIKRSVTPTPSPPQPPQPPQPIPGGVRVRYILPSIKGLHEPVYRTEYYAKGANVTTYPPLPTIPDNRLEFDRYTHTLQELADLQQDIDVGVVLKTVDGKSYLDFILTPTIGLTVGISFQIDGASTFRIDWGDGSYNDYSESNTSLHTYSNYSDYTIIIERISGSGTLFFNADFGTNIQKSITNIYIGNFTNFGNYTFSNCHSLRSVVIPNGITSISSNSFKECFSLRSVIIPNSVKSINDYAFTSCRTLYSVVIPNNVTSINDVTFSECTLLSAIVIPNSVISISNYVFSHCTSLQSVIIQNNVTNIGVLAFSNCVSLRSIIVPNSVTNINAYAFANCYSLTSYTFLSIVPPIISLATFDNITPIAKIYVPDASVAAYKVATNWMYFADKIFPLSEKPE